MDGFVYNASHGTEGFIRTCLSLKGMRHLEAAHEHDRSLFFEV